jgi:hypothetical protein
MKVNNLVRKLVNDISSIPDGLAAVHNRIDETNRESTPQLDDLKVLTAKGLINQIIKHGVFDDIHETEFKVFSQFGDDGIIQYLINNVEIENETFVEFGVENYTEANTRFLLINNNWSGLVMDGSKAHVDHIRNDQIYWRYDLTAVHSFIDKENINGLISSNNVSGPIGILSIDLDGNDYWIWETINVVDPIIVISEYNSVFGDRHAITIPYDPAFYRTDAHYSNLFWGCSLKALCLLAEKKGYAFVGCNSNGNNAYFVRKDQLGQLKPHTVASGYVRSRFRESRDAEGKLTYLAGDERVRPIEDMMVYDLEQSELVKIRDLDIGS